MCLGHADFHIIETQVPYVSKCPQPFLLVLGLVLIYDCSADMLIIPFSFLDTTDIWLPLRS